MEPIALSKAVSGSAARQQPPAPSDPLAHGFEYPTHAVLNPSIHRRWFRAIAEYLDEKGWIAEGPKDYRLFVLTGAGIDEATN